MEKHRRVDGRLSRLDRYVCLLMLFWTASIFLLLLGIIRHVRKHSLEIAQIQAEAAYEKDVAYRHWNSQYGGVYVALAGDMEPNPYLRVPERDITTTSGKALTLVNPAFMTRQVHELGKRDRIIGHLTSLNPIRPENGPDAWERQALKELHDGESEVTAVTQLNGKEHLRLIRPLKTKKTCLKCHGAQGYSEGDIRGALSTSVALDGLRRTERGQITVLALEHATVWLVGVAGVILGSRALRRQIREQGQTNEQLHIEASQREQVSRELRAAATLHEQITKVAATAIFQVSTDQRILEVNDELCRIMGFTREELVGQSCRILGGDSCMQKCGLFGPEKAKLIFRKQCTLLTKDGRPLTAIKNADLIHDESGRVVGGIGSFVDVTELVEAKQKAEADSVRLAEQAQELEASHNAAMEMVGKLQRFNRLAVGREQRMIELKAEVNEMARKASMPPPYNVEALRITTAAGGSHEQETR